MLKAHRRGDAQYRAVMQGADDDIAFVLHLWRRQLLWKTPDLASAGDRRIVVEVHGVHIATFLHRAVLGLEPHREHLAGFGVITKAGRVRHADEFVGDRVASHLQRLRHHLTQPIGVGAVGNDDELAVVEFVGARRISRIVERHGEGVAANLGKLHQSYLLNGSIIAEVYSRPSYARSKVKTPSEPCGRCSTSGWRSVRTASL